MPSPVLHENIVMSGFVVAFLQSTHPSASAEGNLRFVCLINWFIKATTGQISYGHGGLYKNAMYCDTQ